MSTNASPSHQITPHNSQCFDRSPQIHPQQSLRPPLPPRSQETFPNRSHTEPDDENRQETIYDVLSTQCRLSCDNEKESDWYDSPRRIYDTLSPGASLSNISSSPLESTLSTTSLCSSLSSELRLSTLMPSGDNSFNEYDSLRLGDDVPKRTVSLNLTILIEQVMFVDVAGRVWVAGWSEANDRQLSPLFSFGDELVEVEKKPVHGIANVTQLLYSLSTPGTPINLTLRPLPLGTTYRLIKPIGKNKELGIRLHKNKNRIASIVPDSLADRRNVPVAMPSPFRSGVDTAVVITEVNKRRLNPFSKNGQLFKRLDEIRDGSEFDIVLHPHDFIKQIKQQILSVHHYKAFLCQP
ncbi:hypothetical protein DICVIV_07384 [Dictyocaulus viviparus]|uniref:Uncharacterized protein n=1 Tax=Dictyocaulus viviparus TaxID=29172 RepID=A0A0D8XW25_DICVI|nr:hypothetical protein DICVIV_07384 [Dictyocaulus viviparus]